MFKTSVCLLCFTYGVRVGVRMSGILVAVWAATLGQQLHSVGERTVADLVGRRDFHKVDVPRLQLLQQSHGVCPWCDHSYISQNKLSMTYKKGSIIARWCATHPPAERSASVLLATPSGRRIGWCSASQLRWALWAPATTPERCRPRSESLSLLSEDGWALDIKVAMISKQNEWLAPSV